MQDIWNVTPKGDVTHRLKTTDLDHYLEYSLQTLQVLCYDDITAMSKLKDTCFP